MALLPTVVRTSTGSIGGNFISYPKELGTMKRHEHYVMFFINKQANSLINFGDGAIAPSNTGLDGQSNEATTLTIKRAPTKRLSQAIALYMPSSISVSHKANYGEPEMGALTASVARGISDASSMGVGDLAKKIGSEALASMGQGIQQGALQAADATIAPGAEAAAAIMTGKVINNRTELAFEGIERRDFSFSFRMLPTSKEEANQIEKIVTAFRFHSMPEIDTEDPNGRTMIAPSTFDIEYKPNLHLHKISTSVLISVDVSYGGERTQFFTDDHPVETSLTLNFKELEIITKQRIEAGY